jgi:hypothetical protein
VDASYQREYDRTRTVVVGGQTRQVAVARWRPIRINLEILLAVTLFAAAFGAVERMILLRWRRSYVVGAILGLLVAGALALGAHLNRIFENEPDIPSPFAFDFLMLMAWAFAAVLLSATLVWPVWALLVKAFLPRNAATALLSWQREGWKPATALARE